MVTETELFECPVLTPLDFCLCGWNKSDVYKTKVDPPDELLARTLHSAASINKREVQFRQTTRDLRKRISMCTQVDDGSFE